MTTRSARGLAFGFFLLTLLALAVVLVPVILIRPFVPQTPASVSLAFLLRRWSPMLTIIVAALGVLLAAGIWRRAPRLLPRIGVVLGGILIAFAAWGSRQNHFEWMFVPLPDARFARAAQVTTVPEDGMVLAVTLRNDAVAYPVQQLAYHHLVQDSVAGVPIVATY